MTRCMADCDCVFCARFHRDDPRRVCDAFPDGVPDDIFDGEFDHTQPHEGDNGIRFELPRA